MAEKKEMTFDFYDEVLSWKEHWVGMPEFIQEDLSPWKQLTVSFENYEDLQAFGGVVGQKLTPDTRSIWFPEAEINRYADKRYIDEP
jgi:hypothetical protein